MVSLYGLEGLGFREGSTGQQALYTQYLHAGYSQKLWVPFGSRLYYDT